MLYLHPFAEEMNKSRRMAALACRALAEAGHAVLQIDLRGCGDSSADFGDASWGDWQDDVRLGLAWLDAHTPADAPLWLWGLRAGYTAKDWEVFAEARNLGDKQYVSMFSVRDIAGANDAILTPGAPRSLVVGARLKF